MILDSRSEVTDIDVDTAVESDSGNACTVTRVHANKSTLLSNMYMSSHIRLLGVELL